MFAIAGGPQRKEEENLISNSHANPNPKPLKCPIHDKRPTRDAFLDPFSPRKSPQNLAQNLQFDTYIRSISSSGASKPVYIYSIPALRFHAEKFDTCIRLEYPDSSGNDALNILEDRSFDTGEPGWCPNIDRTAGEKSQRQINAKHVDSTFNSSLWMVGAWRTGW